MSGKQSKFGLFFISNENSLQPCNLLTGKQFYCVGSQSDAFFVSTTEGTYSVQSQDNIELFWNESLCQISDGKGFNIGLGLNNKLYSWGFEGEVGQLGQGAAFRKIFEPLEIKNTVDMISISTGESFSISLDEKGHAYSWGEVFQIYVNININNNSVKYHFLSRILTSNLPCILNLNLLCICKML